jgi:FkbM family methyltransferase
MNILAKWTNSRFLLKFRRFLMKKFGINIRIKRFSASSSEDYRLVKILNNYNFDLVLDVGANTGQFAESLIDFNYKGKIVSFEPTSEAHNLLLNRSNNNKNWSIAERMALGNVRGTIDINVTKNSVFSSVKKIGQEYVDYNQNAAIQKVEKVEMLTLDAIGEEFIKPHSNVFLKIDTQGFEKEVLQGATDTLNSINGIKIEMPLIPIYEDIDWDMYDILAFLKEKGFHCVSLEPVAVNNKIGVVHEVDGIFVRKAII